jgi:beta-1,4-mannosyl-glycoprotein beta-1,4-N-acetylglucosaminyltransferase
MIVDSFIFSNELEMLSLRLNYLDSVVDKFILVESPFTHSGESKPLVYDENKNNPKFLKFSNKIEHVIVDDLTGVNHPWGFSWTRENKHRNGILEGLKNVPDDALVMVSDVDEIPRKEKVGQIGAYIQTFLYYYLDVHTGQPWVGTICDTAKNIKFNTPQKFRDERFRNANIINGGWHISFFMTPEEIQNKIKTFAHQEFNKENFTNVENIKERIKNLIDPFDRHNLVPWGIDPTMPEYIFDHPEIFESKFRFLTPY